MNPTYDMADSPSLPFLNIVGIGYTLDPKFSFAKIAAPYAQVSYLSLMTFRYQFPSLVYFLSCHKFYTGASGPKTKEPRRSTTGR